MFACEMKRGFVYEFFSNLLYTRHTLGLRRIDLEARAQRAIRREVTK
jgi:hypothetical protein